MQQKHFTLLFGVLAAVFLVTTIISATGLSPDDLIAKVSSKNPKNTCATIQDGGIYTTDGELISTGYSQWGYNYQGRIFNGAWCDYHPLYRPEGSQYEWCLENYGNVDLMMKWNDAWLSNRDCDGDGKLDRHYGYPSYIGSGAWLTNHENGAYENDNGEICSYNYFVKIVAAPADAYKDNGTWFTAGGREIGPEIWGDFATIQEVSNDSCTGENGLKYKSPVGPGLGKF